MSLPVATLPLAPIAHAVAQSGPDQRVVHGHQAVGERHADVVLVLQRRCAGAALGAVDDDEVRGRALLDHRLADGEDVDPRADAQLEAGRLAAGQLAHAGDELDELDAACGRRGALGGLTHFSPCGTSPDVGDLLADLGRGQHPADAGLGALAQLERDALDGVVGRLVRELAGSKSPSLVRAPK